MIPSARPYMTKDEVKAAGKAILSGWITQGPRVKEFEESFTKHVGASHACAVSNATTAMHLALLAVGVKPGNVVITVSHSFIATANTIRYCGAEPVFVDIDLDTYNISVSGLEKVLRDDCVKKGGALYYKNVDQITSKDSPLHILSTNGALQNERGKVAAIMIVHQMGLPCDLKSILSLTKKYKIPLIEDAACALGSEITFDGKKWEKIGAPHGDVACFSFHPLKIISTGEGGIITSRQEKYDKSMRLLRHQGMNVSDLKRHQSKSVIQEEYPIIGYNYRLTDIQAAIGIEQLKKLEWIIKRRRELAQMYQKALGQIAWLELIKEPKSVKTNWQSFPIRVLDTAPLTRNSLMQYLRDRGVLTRMGIMNAHQEKPYSRIRHVLPNSEKARKSVMILPLFVTMKDAEIRKVIELIKNV